MRKRWTGEMVKEFVEDIGYQLIEVPNWDWVKTRDRITVSCENNEHEPYDVAKEDFNNGSRCKKCRIEEARKRYAFSHEEITEKIKSMNIGLEVAKDSPKYINNRTKLKLWCKKGKHYIFLSWEKITIGRRCAKCSGIYNYSHSEIKDMMKEIDDSYSIMEDSDEYKNNSTKLKIYHAKCDSFFYMAWSKFNQGQRACNCNSNSKYELRASKIMQNHGIDYRKEVVFEGLESDNGVKLRYDFGIYNDNKLLFLIEVDGEQHFNEGSFNFSKDGKSRLTRVQYHDKSKNKYAEENNIPLFRIKYNENIEEVVENILKNFNLIGDVEFE